MNDEYANAPAQGAKSTKRRLFWGIAGAVALLAVALVVCRFVGVGGGNGETPDPSATRERLTALENALESARAERARIDALATKRESEARRLRNEFRRVFFRFDADDRAALIEEMKRGEPSERFRDRADAAKAFATRREWLDVERERAALRRLLERFDGEIARAESERARWARRWESEETLGGAVAELGAENGEIEAVAVVDRLRALAEDASTDGERPLEAISPEELLAFEKAEETALETLVGPNVAGNGRNSENNENREENANAENEKDGEGGENGENKKDEESKKDGENKTTREKAGIPALPNFAPDALPEDAPVAKRLFESQGKKIVDAADRDVQTALDAGAIDVAFAATLDAATELVELAETLGKDRVDELAAFRETARRASWRPTLDALRASTNELAESSAAWPETLAILGEVAAFAPLTQITEVDEAFAQNLTDLQDLARYYESTDESAGGEVRRRLNALLGKSEAEAPSTEKTASDDWTADGWRVAPIIGLLCALILATPLGVGVLLFFFATRRPRRDGNRWENGGCERSFSAPESRPLPNGGLSGRHLQIVGIVFLIGLIKGGPLGAAVAASIAALACAGRFGTALGALGIFAFLMFALILIALTTVAIVVSAFMF